MDKQQTLNEEQHRSRDAVKWAAVVNDALFPMPRRKLMARDILDQTGAGKEIVLVRDFESPHDIAFNDDALVDLADGNVFLTTPKHKTERHHHPITAPAKLAFVCDDVWEITLIGRQTGHSLKRLFGFSDDAKLFRDFESPNDQIISNEEVVLFADGPVFRSQDGHGSGPGREIKIIVNGREKVVTEKRISYLQVVRLAFDVIDPLTIYTVTYKKGPHHKPEGSMVDGDIVHVRNGMIFNVTATRKS